MSDEWIDPDNDRDFRTVVPPALMDELHRSLGKFINAFAHTEVSLNAIVKNFMRQTFGIDQHDLMSALWGGQTMSDAIETIKRLTVACYPKRPDDDTKAAIEHHYALLQSTITHVGNIIALRNKLVHNGAVPDLTDKEGWFYCANNIKIRDFDDMEIVYFKPETLLDAAKDLEGVTLAFSSLIGFGLPLNWQPEPWLYTPSQLRSRGPKSNETLRLRVHRPGSSPKSDRQGEKDRK